MPYVVADGQTTKPKTDPALLDTTTTGSGQQPVQMHGSDTTTDSSKQSGGGSSFDDLKKFVGDVAGSLNSGQFADAELKAAIPIPQVPGLKVTLGGTGSFYVDKNRHKTLQLGISVGVEYGLGSIFNVNATFNESLKLTGENLGEALIDCIKQSAYWVLEQAGVHEEFAELVRLAQEGPGFWDYAKVLVPVYGSYQATRLAITQFGADRLLEAHRQFILFFANNESVGFEASIGLGVGAGFKAGDNGGSGKLEGRVGLEDVDGKDTKAFAELAGEVAGNLGNSSVKCRFAKRFRQGRSPIFYIDVQSALSMPKKAFNWDGSESLVRKGGMAWSIISVVRALGKARGENAEIGEAMGLVNSLLSLGGNVFGNTQAFDSLMGLDFKVSNVDGQWQVDTCKFKTMTQGKLGGDVGAAALEAKVQLGSYYELADTLKVVLDAVNG